jgi:hypothetical protein
MSYGDSLRGTGTLMVKWAEQASRSPHTGCLVVLAYEEQELQYAARAFLHRPETVIQDMLSGHNPIRIIAFNTAQRWSEEFRTM